MSELVNVICLKWGTRYPAFYVNRLYAGVKKHLGLPFRFICVTDDDLGLLPEIETMPFNLPDGMPELLRTGYFTKLALTADGFGDYTGTTLFLDIDQVIVGSLDDLFTYQPGRNCIIHNWLPKYKTLLRGVPHVGNSSCFRFEAGKSHYIFEKLVAEWQDAIDRDKFRTEQAFLTYAMGDNLEWWPDGWIYSMKRHLIPPFPLNLFKAPVLPQGAKIACFHGNPDPEQLIGGFMKGRAYYWAREPKWLFDDWIRPERKLHAGATTKSFGYSSKKTQAITK